MTKVSNCWGTKLKVSLNCTLVSNDTIRDKNELLIKYKDQIVRETSCVPMLRVAFPSPYYEFL